MRSISAAAFVALLSLGSVSAFVPAGLGRPSATASAGCANTALQMALDYNDPAVAEEFAQVQTMEYDDVADEILQQGIPVPPTMTDMDVKLMLVELRIRNKSAGGGGAGGEKKRPTKFGSKFEEAFWTKPAFEEFFNGVKATGDHNKENVVKEYVNNPDVATQRYGKDYKRLLRDAEAALTAPPPVKSATLQFSGFPANMGSDACKMTLEALGPIADFECGESEDFPVLVGRVTFEDIETAKKAVAQYDGMDMGMGSAIEMTSV